MKDDDTELNVWIVWSSVIDLMFLFGSVGGWDEKFLQQESELKRVRSEKANLEQHILGMESELDTLQDERSRLKEEMETQRRACSGLEQQIETLSTEVS